MTRRRAIVMLDVHVCPLLVSGMLTSRDGTDRPLILIDKDQPPEEQNKALWHEIVHLLLWSASETDHDEAEIEMLAQRLHAAWPDALSRITRSKT